VAEHVILFAGPMGAGKTTAIQTLSEIDVVLTEAVNTERNVVDKPTTTVALDYGEITIGDEDKVRLYGVPGQRRFDFMWSILKERAIGMILLVNNDAPDPIALMLEFLEEFGDLHAKGGIVIGITRSDVASALMIDDYSDALFAARPDVLLPVFTVDARDSAQMTILLTTLILNIESRASVTANGAGA
jgi:signal recognition particle receptor subunit beta